MGSAVKSVGKVLTGSVSGLPGVLGLDKITGSAGKSKESGLTQSNFDVRKEAKQYQDVYDAQRAQAEAQQQAANSPAVIAQLSQQALGQGPSIAEAQLRSATNRNLAQQLAAAAAMRGRNPAATQRQVLNMQGDAGRQLAEQSAIARLQEQQQAQQALLAQQQRADALAQQSAQSGFAAALAPKQAFQQYDLARSGIRQQNNASDKQMESQIIGSLIGAGATAATGGLSKGMSGGGAVGPQPVSKVYPTNVMYEKGGKVGGKPIVDGDSPKNDFVHAKLSPGEIVVPRSAAKTPEKAKDFIDALFAKEMARGGRVKASEMAKALSKKGC